MGNFLDEFMKTMTNHMQKISEKVSRDICPLNDLTMPCAVVVLENYAQIIKNNPSFNKDLYDILRHSTESIAVECDCNNPESVKAFEEILVGVMERVKGGGTVDGI